MIDKKASPKGKTVRVTFELPAEAAQESVSVVGDFNDWDTKKGRMKLDQKKNVWTKAVSLKPGSTYRFRYYIDGSQWQNDDQADRQEPSPYASDNSVIDV